MIIFCTRKRDLKDLGAAIQKKTIAKVEILKDREEAQAKREKDLKAFEDRRIRGEKFDRKVEANNLGIDEFNYYNFLDEVECDHDL